MAAGSFFSSLMGSYTDAVRSKHKEQLDKEEKSKDAELGVLKEAVASGRLTQEGIEAAFGRMEELTSTGKGKGGKGKKGGFSFKNLIGQFGDVGQQTNKTLSGGATPQQSPQSAPQQAPQAQPQQGAQPQGGSPTPGGGAPALPALPQRKSMFKKQK